jgi:hypothetical protein
MMIEGKEISITGKFIKTARVIEEWYVDVDEPELIINKLKLVEPIPDIFTFWQRLPNIKREYDYYLEWDSIAAIKIKNYDYWFKKQISSSARRAIRKSKKLGVEVRITDYNDEFVRGMTDIFNESPIRQGKPFWHYGKDFDMVKKEFSKFLFREELIGAFLGDELIGFIMLAYAGEYAMTGQIISKIKYRNKYPNNALISKAVHICEQKKINYLVYLKWGSGSLNEFKRRNGFEKIDLPRYYLPLSIWGKISLKLGVHHGLSGILPPNVIDYLKKVRKNHYLKKYQ